MSTSILAPAMPQPTPQPMPQPMPQPAEVRQRVEAALLKFLAEKETHPGSDNFGFLIAALKDFLAAGGKRLRPVLCVCGWYAAGGAEMTDELVRVAASLELFHSFALIHDDVMDDSDTRRGRPSVHRGLATRYRGRSGPGRAERFGRSCAVLLGDLSLVWSDELLHGTNLDQSCRTAVLDLINTMRTELVAGQSLDVDTTGWSNPDVETALTVARYKTGKYTIERPLHVGAVMGGAAEDVLAACSAIALPLGEAFQLQDDLLGVFGDPDATGKSVTDDLRDGKGSALLALALKHATAGQRRTLLSRVGDPFLDDEGAAVVRRLLVDTGARATVEQMISDRYQRALAALDRAGLPESADGLLRTVAANAVSRRS